MTTPHTGSLEARMREKLEQGHITGEGLEAFMAFVARKEAELDQHEVIAHNSFTKWWKLGEANPEQVKDLIGQFAVFSRLFPLIQALRVYLAETEEEEDDARDILVNESGVNIDMATGSTEGKMFSHRAAHIKWLRRIGEILGFARMDLGRWEHGTPSTHQFLKTLQRLFSDPNRNIRAGASFALESWAGFGIGPDPEADANNFWSELVEGFRKVNASRQTLGLTSLPISFFIYHHDLERAHVENVEHELEETFFHPEFDEENWFAGVRASLDATLIFWNGLNESRLKLEHPM